MYNKNPTLSLVNLKVGLNRNEILKEYILSEFGYAVRLYFLTAFLFLYRLQESTDH